MVKFMRQRREEQTLMSEESDAEQQDFAEMSDYAFNDVLYSECSAMDKIDTFMKNVQVLLDAAHYIDNIEKNNGSKSAFCALLD